MDKGKFYLVKRLERSREKQRADCSFITSSVWRPVSRAARAHTTDQLSIVTASASASAHNCVDITISVTTQARETSDLAMENGQEERLPQLDEKTLSILKEIQMEMDYDDAVVDEEVNWRDIKTSSSDPVDIIKEKVYILKDKICRRFKKSKEVVQDLLPGRQ